MSSLCEKFILNTSVNPYTNRKILVGGPTYRALVKECAGTIKPVFSVNPKFATKRELGSLCEKFRRNETINPATNRKIKVGGPVHKSWDKKCDIKTKEFDVCAAFLKDQTVNPVTGRSIKIGGSVHRALMEKCEDLSLVEKRIKKTLGITSFESKKVASVWFEESKLDEMFERIKYVRSKPERFEIFESYVAKSLSKILSRKNTIPKILIANLFITVYVDKFSIEFKTMGTSFASDMLYLIGIRLGRY